MKTANTCKDGLLLGNMYRAKYTTTGTYAGHYRGLTAHAASIRFTAP
jgi:hypothetical protein